MKQVFFMVRRIDWGKLSIVLLLFGSIAATLFLGGCKEEDPTILPGTGDNKLEVVFNITAGGNDLKLGDSISLATEGFKYRVDLFKFYVSQFKLVKSDNNEVLVKDIDLIDFRTDAPHTSFSVIIPEGEYKALKFGLGVDSPTNMKDPTTFGADHPLSLAKGTYWDMATQYRFLLIEGRLDTLMGTVFDVPFAVHTGFNSMYRQKNFNHELKFTKGDNKKVTITVNIDGLLSGLNFKTNHVSHTMGSGYPLAEGMTTNFINSVSIK